jgi:hypothetical protein
MFVTMLNVHVHAACPCCKDLNMEHWTCIIYMDIQHGHAHAAWAWTRSMDMDMQHGHEDASDMTRSMEMATQHGHGHEYATCT